MKKSAALMSAVALAGGTLLAKDSVPFRFFNIVPCQPGYEEKTAKDLTELRDRTGIDVALYSLTLHPEGYPAFAKVERLTESYRKLRKALEGSGVKPGILLQSVLGHWPRVDKQEEPWTRTVNSDGETPRFCPLDPKFRNYIFDMVVLLAKENPCFIMSDDDVRAFSPKAECFCALHTAEFNKRTGHHFTPEEYRKAVCSSQIGDPVFMAYEKLRRDTTDSVTALIREAIDSVNPAIPSGTCMPWAELIFNGTTCQAMAGKNHPPVMRIANAMYFEGSPKLIPHNILLTQALRDYYPEIPTVLDESDTYPHNLYSRSAQGMHVKLGTSIFCGLNGSKIWFINCEKMGVPISRKYTDVLAKYKKWYPALTGMVRGTQSCGVAIPCFREPYKWHPAKKAFAESSLTPCPGCSWEQTLGMFGIPFHAEYDYTRDQIYMLCGKESVERLTDPQLKELLSRKVFLDGPAAAEVSARGFSPMLGVSAVQKEFRYNQEIGKDGTSLPISKMQGIPFLTILDKKAEVLSDLCYAPYGTSPDREKVAPGTVYYENQAGGKIVTAAFYPGFNGKEQAEVRKLWLADILDKLSGGIFPVRTADYTPTMLLHRQAEKDMLLMVVSLGYDPLDQIQLRMAKVPRCVEVLTSEGSWQKVDFTVNGHIITLPVPLLCYHSQVFRIR